jgi:DNA-binding TFAR19-related protein (PDSD5 family)
MKGIPTPGCPCELCQRARRCDALAELQVGIETFCELADDERTRYYTAALARHQFAEAMTEQTLAALKAGQSTEQVVSEAMRIFTEGAYQTKEQSNDEQ